MYFMPRLGRFSFHLIDLVAHCKLTGKVQLVILFIQVCILHSPEESQYARYPDSVFITIVSCLVQKMLYLFELCHN